MIAAILRAVALSLSLPLACGGTTTSTSVSATDGGSPSDALSSDALLYDALPPEASTGDAAACVASAQEGAPCTAGEVSCDRVDLCCASALTCEAGLWKLTGQECLLCQTHPCGTATCQGTEMCVERSSGVDGGSPSYVCVPYPSDCARQWTCGCVLKHASGICWGSPGSCTDTSFPVKLLCMGM